VARAEGMDARSCRTGQPVRAVQQRTPRGSQIGDRRGHIAMGSREELELGRRHLQLEAAVGRQSLEQCGGALEQLQRSRLEQHDLLLEADREGFNCVEHGAGLPRGSQFG
jgi:hypothetical protein